jgi:cell fate regulator YaaT (PSP1 superfamily)
MKLVRVEYTFDRSKMIFYFTADGRIDFRELVKDLAAIFRTRIELRQIGVRDGI